jgi:hypothetical protein
MTTQAKALQPRFEVAKLQHVKPPQGVHSVCRFSCLSLTYFLDCTQLALGRQCPIRKEKNSKASPICKRTHSRVGSRAFQLHSKGGRAIEYFGTNVMDPQDDGHNPGTMTMLCGVQFARKFACSQRIRKRNSVRACAADARGQPPPRHVEARIS